MASRKKQRSKTRTKTKRRSQRNAGQTPRRRRDEKAALRGMMLGGGILILIAFLAFVRIGGDTPLNHFMALFSSDEVTADKDTGPKAKKTPPIRQKAGIKGTKPSIKLTPRPSTTPKTSVTGKPIPTNPAAKVSKNAAKAPPQEKLTDGDKAGLDKLIKTKTQ